MINDDKISVVFNGRYEKKTKFYVIKVRKILPKSEIILSSYKEALQDKKIYKKNKIKLIINKDAGDYLEFPDNPKNLLRMMKTFYNGLKISKNKIILRLRTDYSLNKTFKKELNELDIKKNKIIFKDRYSYLDTIYSTYAAHLDYDNFHFSDQVLLGTKKQFIKLYYVNKKKFLKEKDFSKLPMVNGKYGSLLASEQIIWINYLKRVFKEKDAFKIYQDRKLHNQVSKNIKLLNNKMFVVPPRLRSFKVKMRSYAMNNYNILAYLMRAYYFIKNYRK